MYQETQIETLNKIHILRLEIEAIAPSNHETKIKLLNKLAHLATLISGLPKLTIVNEVYHSATLEYLAFIELAIAHGQDSLLDPKTMLQFSDHLLVPSPQKIDSDSIVQFIKLYHENKCTLPHTEALHSAVQIQLFGISAAQLAEIKARKENATFGLFDFNQAYILHQKIQYGAQVAEPTLPVKEALQYIQICHDTDFKIPEEFIEKIEKALDPSESSVSYGPTAYLAYLQTCLKIKRTPHTEVMMQFDSAITNSLVRSSFMMGALQELSMHGRIDAGSDIYFQDVQELAAAQHLNKLHQRVIDCLKQDSVLLDETLQKINTAIKGQDDIQSDTMAQLEGMKSALQNITGKYDFDALMPQKVAKKWNLSNVFRAVASPFKWLLKALNQKQSKTKIHHQNSQSQTTANAYTSDEVKASGSAELPPPPSFALGNLEHLEVWPDTEPTDGYTDASLYSYTNEPGELSGEFTAEGWTLKTPLSFEEPISDIAPVNPYK